MKRVRYRYSVEASLIVEDDATLAAGDELSDEAFTDACGGFVSAADGAVLSIDEPIEGLSVKELEG